MLNIVQKLLTKAYFVLLYSNLAHNNKKTISDKISHLITSKLVSATKSCSCQFHF